MKFAIVAAVLLLAGCQDKTQYGECIGMLDDRDPAFVWKISTQNVVWGAVLLETIAVPLFVGLDRTYCPVGRK